MKKRFIFLVSLLLTSSSCFADWNMRGMWLSLTKFDAEIKKDASISIEIAGSRNATGRYTCSAYTGPQSLHVYRYVLWKIDNPRINNIPIRFSAPVRLQDNIASNGYFDVVASKWEGNSFYILGKDNNAGLLLRGCAPGGPSGLSASLTGKSIENTFPAGNHSLSLNLSVLRIMHSNPNGQSVLAESIPSMDLSNPIYLSQSIVVNSYCTNINVSSVTLNHGKFAVGTGNGNEASATVEYECNLDTAKPKITFTGADVTSGNQVKICDGLFSMLSATTEKTQGYNFKTVFKSTLSGDASSSCAGSFSKNVVAKINPP
ncbi:hypothetical protein ACS106_004402 [Escherichia coli]